MNLRTAIVGTIALAGSSVSVLGCASPLSRLEEVVGGSKAETLTLTGESLSGDWRMTNEDGCTLLKMTFTPDNSFTLSGDGCNATGTWELIDGTLVTNTATAVGPADCPEGFNVEAAEIVSMYAFVDGTLDVTDSNGNLAVFVR